MNVHAHAIARDIAYLGAVFLWSILGFSLWVTGVSVTASLLVLVVGLPAWVAFAYLMRWTTRVDRRLAGWLRGTPVEATYAGRREPGFLALVRTITRDPQTWRDLGWLVVGSLVGLALSSATLAMLGVTLQYLTSPLWSWAINDPEAHYGLTNLVLFTNDTLVEAFAVAGIGLLLAPITLLLAHACATTHAALATRLLSPSRAPEAQLGSPDAGPRRSPAPTPTDDAAAAGTRPAVARATRRRALATHAVLFAGLGGLSVLIWALTSHAYFWPAWPLIVLAVPLAVHAWVELLAEHPQVVRAPHMTSPLTVQQGVSATLFLFLVAVWALTTRAYFWPVWPLLGLAIPFAIHALVVSMRGRLIRRG